MRLWLHLGARVLGWTSLAVLLLAGLAAMAGVVEGVRWGTRAAVRLAALELLPVVVPVVPVACAVGAGVAAARLRSLGEAVALESVGLPPWRAAAVAGAVGLLVGQAGYQAHLRVVPEAAEAALALRIALGSAEAPAGWLWTGDALLRTRDGLRVHVDDGRIAAVHAGQGPPDPDRVRRARALRQPVVAGPVELAADLLPLRVEAALRRARALSCGLLAALAWLGPGSRREARLAPAVALGLAYQALSLGVVAMAASGRLPVAAGALLPPALLATLLTWRLAR